MSLRNFKRDVALLTIGSAFEKTQAARTLACHGAADCDAADAIVAAGAIDPLVALVTNGAAGGQKQAVRALQNLARNDANRGSGVRRLLRARAGGRLRAVRSLLRVLEVRPTPIGVSDLPQIYAEAADLYLRIHYPVVERLVYI